MTRYVAFLRGVNLGKRQTKSADLVAVFESHGFWGVKTLIASGNVLFETDASKGLQGKIEKALKERFGFEIGVILRSMDELKAMIASTPFANADGKADVTLHVLLFVEPMKAPLPKLEGVAGDYDVARLDPTEIFFVVHKKPDGTFLGRSAIGEIDKLLPKGALVTMRNWNTIEKAAAK
jgi:uncharacterized protein (DUF1697 family)